MNKYCVKCGNQYFIDKKNNIKHCLKCGQEVKINPKFKKEDQNETKKSKSKIFDDCFK